MQDFLAQYLQTALWSSSDNSCPETGGAQLSSNFTVLDFTQEALDQAEDDCAQFLAEAGHLITEENFTGRADGTVMARAGHDFWLTRCGHGAGFWDGDWGAVGDQLTNAAKLHGNVEPCVIGEFADGEWSPGSKVAWE